MVQPQNHSCGFFYRFIRHICKVGGRIGGWEWSFSAPAVAPAVAPAPATADPAPEEVVWLS
ncbi:hypothetical protein F2Q68_00033319 [Brassica cretica]|uniref:Uncharacterized protein n=1 Tax=Brassica cretica TaxID=69181 RepID=A0A8S9G7U5_BRACR|nr:hypothetical protein F2Q68_00033319 [Brassica cretica]